MKYFCAFLLLMGLLLPSTDVKAQLYDFNSRSYIGHWSGPWNNTTFGSTGPGEIDITVDVGNSSTQQVVDLGGNVFGSGDPGPFTLDGILDENGILTLTGTSPDLGTLSYSVDINTGIVNGIITNIPSPGVDDAIITGTYAPTAITLNTTINFTGGGSADATLTFNKQTIINPPTNLVTDVNPGGFVDLSWLDNSNDETAFNVDRMTIGGTPQQTVFEHVGQTTVDGTTFTDNTVAPGTTYDYYVYASNPTTASVYSNVSRVTTPAANQPPTADDDQATTFEDQSVTIDVLANDNDPDSDPLALGVADDPSHGTVTINDNGTPTDPSDDRIDYTPNTDYFGDDTFRYEVDDGGVTDDATVTISVTPVNDEPEVTLPASVTVHEDAGPQALTFGTNISPGPANESDQRLSFTVTDVNSDPPNGMFTLPPTVSPDGTLSFETGPNVFGVFDLYVTVTDDGGTYDGGDDTLGPVPFTLDVQPVVDDVVAVDDVAGTPEDTPVTIDVLDNDLNVDGGTLTVSDVGQPNNGETNILPSGSTVLYAPDPGFSGLDTFEYTVSAYNGTTAIGTVSVNVSSVNDAPVAQDDVVTTFEDTPVDINVSGNDTDGDGDDLLIDKGAPPGNGTIEINDNGTPADPFDDTMTYSPSLNFFGIDTFTYTIDDSQGGTDAATVTITVESVNDPPVAGNVTRPQDGSQILFGGGQGMAPGDPAGDFTIDFTAPSDVENDPLTNTVQLGTTPDFSGSSVLIIDVNVGTDTQYQTTVGVLATELTNNGVDLFGSIDAYLRVVTSDGAAESASPTVTLTLTRGTLSDVASDQELPDTYELLQNYPNPFNPETTIEYRLPEVIHVQIEVVDLQGRRVALLVDRIQPAGRHRVSFNAEDLPSGIYMYQMRAGDFTDVKELILLK